MRFVTGVVAAAFVGAAGLAATPRSAAALDLIPSLPCALTSTSKGTAAAPFCVKIYNTCNTPIISTLRDSQTGSEQDMPQIPSGQTGKLCGAHPLELVGHTLGGP